MLSDGSGTFENATQRKKSHSYSDKGYGSITSVSSGSPGDSKWYLLPMQAYLDLGNPRMFVDMLLTLPSYLAYLLNICICLVCV